MKITQPGRPIANTASSFNGPARWSNLHRRALSFTGDSATELAFVNQLGDGSGCGCKSHWRQWVSANPPDFASAETYFAWSVEAHNAVNARLGKPVMTIEAAREWWMTPPDDIKPCDWCGKPANVTKGQHCMIAEWLVCGSPMCAACHKKYTCCKRHIYEHAPDRMG